MSGSKPQYDFSHPVFKKNFIYRRFAKEHLSLDDLHGDVIKYEVKSTVGPMKVPNKYHIHYYLKSIVNIDADQNPIYGDHHIIEVELPKKYPLEPAKIYAVSDIWHPNIKASGKFKGRVCGNTRDFGKGYDLYQLVLRIGEILQYKNYHAVHTPPYPEDAQVADWVLEYAEPNDIVNKAKGIVIDARPLLGHLDASAEQEETKTEEPAKSIEDPKKEEPREEPKADRPRPKIRLSSKGVAPKSGIKIKPK